MAVLDSSRPAQVPAMGLPSVHPAEEGSSIPPLSSPLAPAAEDLQQRSPSAHPQQEKLLHQQEFPRPTSLISFPSSSSSPSFSHEADKAMGLARPSSLQLQQQQHQQQQHQQSSGIRPVNIDHFHDAQHHHNSNNQHNHRAGSKQFAGLSPSSAPKEPSLEPTTTILDHRPRTIDSPTTFVSPLGHSFFRPHHHYDKIAFDPSSTPSSSSFRQPIETPPSVRDTRRDHPFFPSSSSSSNSVPVDSHRHGHRYSSPQAPHQQPLDRFSTSSIARSHPPPESTLTHPGEISALDHGHPAPTSAGYIALDRSGDEPSRDHRRRAEMTPRTSASSSATTLSVDPPYNYASTYSQSSSSTPSSSSSQGYKRSLEEASISFSQRGSQAASPLPADRAGAQHRRPVVHMETLDRSFAHPHVDHSIEQRHSRHPQNDEPSSSSHSGAYFFDHLSQPQPYPPSSHLPFARSESRVTPTGGSLGPRRAGEEPPSFTAAYGPSLSSPSHMHHQHSQPYHVSDTPFRDDYRERRSTEGPESSFSYPHGPKRQSYSYTHHQEPQHSPAPVHPPSTHGALDQPYPYSSAPYGSQPPQHYPPQPQQQHHSQPQLPLRHYGQHDEQHQSIQSTHPHRSGPQDSSTTHSQTSIHSSSIPLSKHLPHTPGDSSPATPPSEHIVQSMRNVRLEQSPQHSDSLPGQQHHHPESHHVQQQQQHGQRLPHQQPQHQDEDVTTSWTSSQTWESTSSKDRALENMMFKFGTDMPTTIDLQSAVDCCDMLCRFALQYASQAAGDNSYMDISHPIGEEEAEALERTNLQAIRNLSSTMLMGLQHSGRGTDGASGSGIEDPLLQAAIDKDTGHGGEDKGPRFGPGPASNEMRHELAKSATAIFQLAIRIKAWVNMTPAERVLDEEINIIRGKRCLFMDGTTTIPMPTIDPQHQHQRAKDWALAYTQAQTTLQGFHGRTGQDQSERDHSSHDRRHPAHQGSSSLMRTEGGSTVTSSSRMMGQGSMMARHKSAGVTSTAVNPGGGGPGSKSEGSDRGDNPPHQKYRKRAKRNHPPGRCLSCDTSDTPEWRRGPDGARTLCNACGLHYAKLLKRQQHQIMQGQDPEQIQLQVPIFSQFSQRALPSTASATGGSSEGPGTPGGSHSSNRGKSRVENEDEEMKVVEGNNNSESSNNNTNGPGPMDQDDSFTLSSSSSSSLSRPYPQLSSSHSGSSTASQQQQNQFSQSQQQQQQQQPQQQPNTQAAPADSDVIPSQPSSNPEPSA